GQYDGRRRCSRAGAFERPPVWYWIDRTSPPCEEEIGDRSLTRREQVAPSAVARDIWKWISTILSCCRSAFPYPGYASRARHAVYVLTHSGTPSMSPSPGRLKIGRAHV